MALLNGQLYIANTDALVRVPYTDGATQITAKPELVVKLNGGGNHWARTLIAAPDGKTLFVGVGSASNIAEKGLEAEKFRANILQVYPDQKTFRIYASGLRNPQGMAISPYNQQLWTVVNERDMLGSDLAPDYLTQVELGDQFGWPWFYWGGYPDNRVEPQRPDLQQYSKRPDYALGPHVAALGLAFANGMKLGDRYAQGALIGEHGSWNRKPVSGYKVVFVPFAARGFPADGVKPQGRADRLPQRRRQGPRPPRSAWNRIAPARCWSPTTLATRSGASRRSKARSPQIPRHPGLVPGSTRQHGDGQRLQPHHASLIRPYARSEPIQGGLARPWMASLRSQ